MAARSTSLPERFGLDRLATPIGTALLVTDAEGALRALDWDDYEHRMRELLRLHYGAVDLSQRSAPAAIKAALSDYFAGNLGRLSAIAWRIAGTPFHKRSGPRLRKSPPAPR
ncbi:O6-methylguanine-DNA--protein-cysteine methyltransferase [Bradyrhizobium diazoefficiens]|jgi:methylated-DNA-[protein]-cysteine S-methyltransferase|uniref:Methylated-DNA-[protein]-cysteineS-methyltransferase n=1 Tax=Bradyrhizobium diazoefficiens TaxID=1355477 RepID=A0A0E4BP66_9BRAD|nr:methylated-DNA-[protein]-cysteineS-methyltransferase [Bradyrhizobium diazoefficiens]